MAKQQSRLSRKGAAAPIFSSLPAIFLGLLFAVIMGAIVALITSGIYGGIPSQSNSLVNSSVTFVGGAAQLAFQAGKGGVSVLSVNNFTNNTFGSNNYVVNSTWGDVHLLAGASDVASQGPTPTLNFTYNYLTDSRAQEVLSNSTLGVQNIFVQFGTVGTVVGVMLILLAVLWFLGRGAGKGKEI